MKLIICAIPAALVIFLAAACNKTPPAEPPFVASKTVTPTITITPTMTNTPTVTPTATFTITPDAASKNYGFEDNTAQGWIKDNNAPATISSAASAAQAYNASSYSLAVMCAYSSGNDLVQIIRQYVADPVNLSGKTISAFMYVSSAMFGTGTYHPEAQLVNYTGTVLPLTDGPDFMSSGWNQAVFAVPAGVDYEMIREIRIGLKDDSGSVYNDYLYLDDITW